jgi:alpha-tubulin suppressor-like RCC1 family protein
VLGQDRTVRCFGYNPNGELGNGLTLNGATATIQRVLELDRVVQLSASSNNTCALQDSGRVFCWGAGSSGQNGNGATGSTVPRAVVGLGDVVELRSAPEASMQCARRRDGTVWCWGQNNVGQLGDGTTTQRNVPTQVSGLGDAAQLAIGPNHACAVRGDRTVWCWGQNNNYELGDGTTTQRTTPVQPTAYGTPIVGVTEVSVSSDHTCVRMASGIVQCWGYNAFGNLADGTTTQRPHPITISTYACGGVLIGSFCSDCQPLTCAQAGVTNGVVSNGCGGTLSCGSGGATPRVPPATDTLELATGDNFTCARMNNGRVRCWGSGTSGQLGGTSTFDSLEPVDVAGVEDAAQVVAGVRFACARTTSGAVLCWGNDQYGQLGDGQATNAAFPARMVLGLDGTRDRAVEIAAGGYHACARIDDGTVRCWGFNGTGALGDGTTASRGTPVTVAGLRSVTSLSAGYGFTCVVSNGGVVCWGQNGNYQLGDGSSIERTTPTESGSLPTGVSRVVAAFNGYYACAIMNDGQVQCWGQNNNGQLGDDSTNDRSSAAPVVGLSDVTQLSLGTYHACARIVDGTVRCWGQNNNFELADGTTTQRRVPTVTQVNADTLRNVRSVLAGSDNTCAIFTNGQVGCWGYGLQGQLGNQSANQERSVAMTYAMPCGGDGTSEACSTSCVPRTCGPRGTQAGIIADGCGGTLYCGAPAQHSLSAGNAFWCERTGAGAARCWGNNTYGQLGNGNTTASSSPVTPTGLSSGVVSIAAGTYHACATTTDGAAAGPGLRHGAPRGVGDRGPEPLVRARPGRHGALLGLQREQRARRRHELELELAAAGRRPHGRRRGPGWPQLHVRAHRERPHVLLGRELERPARLRQHARRHRRAARGHRPRGRGRARRVGRERLHLRPPPRWQRLVLGLERLRQPG